LARYPPWLNLGIGGNGSVWKNPPRRHGEQNSGGIEAGENGGVANPLLLSFFLYCFALFIFGFFRSFQLLLPSPFCFSSVSPCLLGRFSETVPLPHRHHSERRNRGGRQDHGFHFLCRSSSRCCTATSTPFLFLRCPANCSAM